MMNEEEIEEASTDRLEQRLQSLDDKWFGMRPEEVAEYNEIETELRERGSINEE